MRRSLFCMLVLGLCLVSVGRAQTVTGSGTPGNIAKFTGPSVIGNSVLTENNGNIGIGTSIPLFPLVVTNATGFGTFPSEAFFETNGTDRFTAAIRALAGMETNNLTFAIDGVTFSSGGIGVQGNATNPQGGIGVHGQASGTNANGVSGTALGTSGPGIGVVGQTFSPNGIGGLFDNAAGGNILVGGVGQPETTVFRVDGRGTVFADGGFRPFGADFAESLAVKGSREHYAPGDLLVIDPSGERRLSLAGTPYSTLVAGIYSTKPGVVASQHQMDDPAMGNEVPLAVVGIVPCKVTAENGPIAVGDLLVTSSTLGRAMKGTDRNRMLGAVVGKALEPLREGNGVIQVLVTLQ